MTLYLKKINCRNMSVFGYFHWRTEDNEKHKNKVSYYVYDQVYEPLALFRFTVIKIGTKLSYLLF